MSGLWPSVSSNFEKRKPISCHSTYKNRRDDTTYMFAQGVVRERGMGGWARNFLARSAPDEVPPIVATRNRHEQREGSHGKGAVVPGRPKLRLLYNRRCPPSARTPRHLARSPGAKSSMCRTLSLRNRQIPRNAHGALIFEFRL